MFPIFTILTTMKNSALSVINYAANTLLRTQRLLFASSVLFLLTPQLVEAQDAKVTAVRLSRVEGGFNMFLKTTNNCCQALASSQGNTLVVDLTNAQLNLSEGKVFRQNNPAPGITSVAIAQFWTDSLAR